MALESQDEEVFLGVIEGFYGRPWAPSQREELLDQLKEGVSANPPELQKHQRWCYIYAPKDDSKHRAEWRALYDDGEARVLDDLISSTNKRGLRFVYALSPGLDMKYDSQEDINSIIKKLQQLVSLGCRDFAIFFDDIDTSIEKGLLGKGQADVSNQLYAFLASSPSLASSNFQLLFCPTEYCEMMAIPSLEESPYLRALAVHLHPRIRVMWTGDDIIASEISAEHLRRVGGVLKRKPFIWDNFFANDYDLRRIYLGPLEGRPQTLLEEELISGFVLNPNREHPANFVPVATLRIWSELSRSTPYEPRAAVAEAAKLWLPKFEAVNEEEQQKGITLEDVQLLIDILYQPRRHGETANNFINAFRSLTFEATASTSSSSSSLEKLEKKKGEFLEQAKRITNLFRKLTCIKDRDLLYTLYGFAWEAKEEAYLLIEFIEHLFNPKVTNKLEPGFFRFHKPGTFRGGFVADLQRSYHFNTVTGGVTPLLTTIPSSSSPTSAGKGWRIEPYSPEYLEGVLRVCLETGNSGQDGTHLYPNHPQVLGQRYIGPYVTLQPDLAFVLLDDSNGVCGYVAGALDTIGFYEKVKQEWYPKMRELYPDISFRRTKEEKDWTPEEWIIDEFHHPRFFTPKELIFGFPSHLHIDLIAKAQGQGLGSMLLTRLLETMKKKGARGVFLEMSSVNHRAYAFYHKFGFVEVCRHNDKDFVEKTYPESHCIVLAKTL